MSITSFRNQYVRRTPEQWQTILIDQQKSGLSQKAFCQQHGLSVATFSNWKRELIKTPGNEEQASDSPPDWIEVPARASEPDRNLWEFELELPGGITLRMRQ